MNSVLSDNVKFQELNEIIKKIRQLPMIRTRQFNEEDLQQLKVLLNSALPRTDMDKGQARLIRYFSSHSSKKAIELVNEIRAYGLILWMDARTLINSLKLHNLVFLQWDKENSCYDVQKYEPQRKTA